MPADFIINAGDAGPVFAQQILDSSLNPMDVSGASIALRLRSLISPTLLTLTGTVSSPSPTTGILQWQPVPTDTAGLPGDYQGKWLVTFAGGKPQQYPTDGYIWVRIEPDLAAEPQALVSLPQVKDYINQNGGSVDRTHDAKLLGLIQAATMPIENIAGPILTRTLEEWHDGGQYSIQLRRRASTALGTTPILTIIACDEFRGASKYSLTVVTDPTLATIYSVMLNPQTGRLTRRTTGGGIIPYGAGPSGGSMPDAVHVTYQVGQTSIPFSVQEATLEAIRQHHMTTQATGRGSLTQADTFDQTPGVGFASLVDRIARQSLSPMKRHPSFG